MLSVQGSSHTEVGVMNDQRQLWRCATGGQQNTGD